MQNFHPSDSQHTPPPHYNIGTMLSMILDTVLRILPTLKHNSCQSYQAPNFIYKISQKTSLNSECSYIGIVQITPHLVILAMHLPRQTCANQLQYSTSDPTLPFSASLPCRLPKLLRTNCWLALTQRKQSSANQPPTPRLLFFFVPQILPSTPLLILLVFLITLQNRLHLNCLADPGHH
jgi:hypothetical protein